MLETKSMTPENEFIFEFPDPNTSLSTRFIPNSNRINKILDMELEETNKNKTKPAQPAQQTQQTQPAQPAQPAQQAQQAQPAQQAKFKLLTKNKTKLIDDDKDLDIKPDLPIKKITQIQMQGPANFINCTNEIELKSYAYFNEPMKSKDFNIINSILCSYQLIIELINNNNNTNLTLINIINDLIKKYNELFQNETYKQIILSSWNNEGKQDISKLLTNKLANLEDIITDNTYFITTTDIMLLANIYKIPIVLFSNEQFNDLNIKINSLNIYFLINKEKNIKILTAPTKIIKPAISANRKYYYIYISKTNGNFNYKLFYNSLDEFKLSETVVISEFIQSINTATSYVNTILS